MSVNGQDPKTLLIVLGAMKSGTSSLFDLLARHPAICPSLTKEPYFFADETQCCHGHAAYFKLWQPEPGQTILMEGSTDYTKYPYIRHVPERLKALEDAGHTLKFIYIMRHPVARMESHVRHLFLHRCDVIQRPVELARFDVGILDRFVALSSYAFQLDKFRQCFERDQFFLTTFERLMADRTGTVNEILDFLGLSPMVDEDFKAAKAANVTENVRTWHYLPSAYRILTDNYLIKNIVSPRIPERWKENLRNRVTRQYPHRVTMTDEEKIISLEHLKPDLRRLKEEWQVSYVDDWGITL